MIFWGLKSLMSLSTAFLSLTSPTTHTSLPDSTACECFCRRSHCLPSSREKTMTSTSSSRRRATSVVPSDPVPPITAILSPTISLSIRYQTPLFFEEFYEIDGLIVDDDVIVRLPHHQRVMLYTPLRQLLHRQLSPVDACRSAACSV